MDQWYVMKPETNKIKDHLKLLPLTEKVKSLKVSKPERDLPRTAFAIW